MITKIELYEKWIEIYDFICYTSVLSCDPYIKNLARCLLYKISSFSDDEKIGFANLCKNELDDSEDGEFIRKAKKNYKFILLVRSF